jgi:hypothetical protein
MKKFLINLKQITVENIRKLKGPELIFRRCHYDIEVHL